MDVQVKTSFQDAWYRSVNSISEFIDKVTWEGVSGKLHWVNTIDSSELLSTDSEDLGLGNVSRINNIRRINKFLEKANHCLKNGQLLVIKVEIKGARRKRILSRWMFPLNYMVYFLDFMLNRVVPKISIFQKLYFHLTKGKNRPLSLTEALGRLICCGFHILEFKEIDGTVYIVSKKVKSPAYDMDPSYSLLIRLKRVGKDEKLFNVFKLRTMHPYSEYLQGFMYERYKLKKGGKINNDIRMTSWGKVFRKHWIDELPMIINFLKGQVKIVGVRPLSAQYFNLYPKDLQEIRTSVKPGLIPPYYADLPKDLEEIHESERVYLMSYKKKPLLTDFRYFCKASWNILFRGARSS